MKILSSPAMSRGALAFMRQTRGFTLVEVLVALSVLSIAAIALLKVQSSGAAVSFSVRERLLAEIVAENVMVEAVATPKTVENDAGDVKMAGQSWHWTREIKATTDRDIQNVVVSVSHAAGAPPIATLTAFRGAQ